jgi:hypothetical protein
VIGGKRGRGTEGKAVFIAAAEVDDGAIVVSPSQFSHINAFRQVNTVISNLKTAIRGTDHQVNVHTYVARDIAETQDRRNRRFDLASLVERLRHAGVLTPPSPVTWLRQGAVRSA